MFNFSENTSRERKHKFSSLLEISLVDIQVLPLHMRNPRIKVFSFLFINFSSAPNKARGVWHPPKSRISHVVIVHDHRLVFRPPSSWSSAPPPRRSASPCRSRCCLRPCAPARPGPGDGRKFRFRTPAGHDRGEPDSVSFLCPVADEVSLRHDQLKREIRRRN